MTPKGDFWPPHTGMLILVCTQTHTHSHASSDEQAVLSFLLSSKSQPSSKGYYNKENEAVLQVTAIERADDASSKTEVGLDVRPYSSTESLAYADSHFPNDGNVSRRIFTASSRSH